MNYPQTKTLAFIFTAFPPEVSGAAILNWKRIQWFAKQKIYRVVVLAPDCQGADLPSVPPDLSNNLVIETYSSKPWRPYKLHYVPTLAAVSEINDKLAYYKPDLITVMAVESYFWYSTWRLPGRGYAKAHNIPYIGEHHTDYYNLLLTYPGGKWLRDLVWKPVSRYLYNQCDIALAISPTSSKCLQRMKISNFRLIPICGIDADEFSPNRRNREFLEQWLTPQERDNKVLLFVGRLATEKRVDLLIEAFARLEPKQNNYSLIIAGDGPVKVIQKLKHLAEPISNVHFIGFIKGEKKANLFASCDVFCSPSTYETFGLTGVEAMASGIPVVVVNSGGVSDYLIDGVNGYLVAPEDIEQLTNAIEKALSNNNIKMIERALQDAKQFSVEQGCQNLNNYYQQLFKAKIRNKKQDLVKV